MAKRNLYLVSTPAIKKKYNMFFVFMADGSTCQYDLNEWNVVRDDDWIEVSKLNHMEMNCHMFANILGMRFSRENKEVPILKPVPPAA